VVLLGAAIGFGVVGAGVAFGYWLTSDSSNPAQAAADTLPTGATPAAPTTSPSTNSNSVVVAFTQATTTTGHTAIPASNYSLRRYPAAGGSAVAVTASCSGTGTITCMESSVPDGKWQYTDTPTYGTNWVGVESAKSPAVTVDTTPPSASVTFPVPSGVYSAAAWNNLAPISGTASDATSGISGASSINLIITQAATGATWNGTTFATGANSVHPTTYSGSSWTYSFPSSDFPADGTYSVGVKATDAAGNTSSVSTNTFTYDSTPPTGSVSYTNGYVTSPSVAVTFSATDAVSGVNTASGQLERASAPLAGGTCGSFSSFGAVGPTGVTSPYTDSSVTSGSCYEYEYIVSDNAGNTATVTSADVVKVDTAAPPVPTLTYSALTNAYASGATVYYRPGAASGTFTVTAASTDPLSGIATYTFPALGAGWTVTGSGSTRTYTWSSANPSTSSGPFAVTATNGAGLTSSGSDASDPFSLTPDSTAPTGGSIKANGSAANSYNTTGTVALAVTNFTDSGSGLATNTITRSSATLTNNTCGPLTGAAPVTVSGGDDSATLSSGCYQYTLTGTDNVGNVATVASAVVMVDTSPPVLTITANGPNVYYPGSGSTVYFSGTGTTSSFTLTASDPTTGISSTTFPAAPAGWTKSTGTNSATYTRSSATASSSLTGVSATNNAGSSTSETVTITVDKTAPGNSLSLSNQAGGGSALSNLTVYYQGSVAGSLTITNAVSDSVVAPASSTFAALGGTSTGFTFTAGTVSTPAGGPYVSSTLSWAAGTTSSPTETVTGTDSVGNTVATTITFVDDTNTLTQNGPIQLGNTYFWGSASSSANPVTVYYCLGTVTSCTASTAAGSVTATPGGGGFWIVGTGLATGQAYTSEAYQTDPDGLVLESNVEQFST
jgi:Bacterial Ig-like domain